MMFNGPLELPWNGPVNLFLNIYRPKNLKSQITKTNIKYDELVNVISSDVTILKIVRMTKKVQNKTQPTTRVKIFFKGLNLPQYVKLYEYSRTEKTPACRTCFVAHKIGEDCDPEPRCSNCSGDHEPTFRKCPARIKAYTIKKIMTIENLAFREARSKYSAVFTNRFEIFNENEDEIFPAIKNRSKNQKQTQNNTVNNTLEAAKFLHSSNSFAKVTKNNQNRIREEANARKNMEEYKQALNSQETYKSPNGIALQSQYEKFSQMEKSLGAIVQNIDELKEKCMEKLGQEALLHLEGIRQKMIMEMLNLDVHMIDTANIQSDRTVRVSGSEEEL
ncbi:uncharacterized protein [Musca autumnalis]|uniref:uncharacterized protein n=1 Tax=Musca autumnalis TaxID=221902 RepID=UPI003CEE8824